MKLTINPSLCVGCLHCSNTWPQAFKYNSDEMQSYVSNSSALTDEEAEKAIDWCPSHAISRVEE